MKKLICLLLALSAELVSASGRLSTVSVSENGTVMLATGSPSEFKSSWSGQPGQYKMIIELPGVTVDKTAKVMGNLAANRGIRNVRFSQFQTEPPVARVIIETSERLSYSWSTKPEGVELHFMLPSPVTTTAKTTSTGIAVPANVFSQNGQTDPASANKRMTPPPASTARQSGTTVVAPQIPKTDAKASTATPQNSVVKAPASVAAGKTAPMVAVPASKGGSTPVSTGSTSKTTDSAVKLPGSVTVTPVPAGIPAKQAAVNETVKPATTAGPPAPSVTVPTPGKEAMTVKAPASGPSKDSAPTSAVPAQQGKTGTTTPAKITSPAGTSPVPTSGGTGVVVKPTSPATGQAAQVGQPKAATGTPTVVMPGTAGAPTAAMATGKPASSAATATTASKPMDASKAASPTGAKPITPTPPSGSSAAAKPTVTGNATDTVDQAKFKEQLKKALGKVETPAQPTGAKQAETGTKVPVPVDKTDQTSFQEQLKQALDPAKSLADTSEVADLDDIDTDLPATDEDEEEEPYDTTNVFPGGTFMQVSPSRKVIRYHSEGRRDPFSPLTGRDRYASGKKRRAVPAAEQLRLVGVMRSLAGNKAILEDGEGNGYVLAPGDRVRNGYLVSVSESKVLFQVTEYGWTKTVAMELGTFE